MDQSMNRIDPECFDAVILDLDGVITQTARVHSRAWKKMFDNYLAELRDRGGDEERLRPFDENQDYREYVDGKPRYDGVQSFLQSRGIELGWGDPGDPPDRETICGLGNRKNKFFSSTVEQEGVDVYWDSVACLREWRGNGLKTAIVSSSRNCAKILDVAGLAGLFDVRVDGLVSAEIGLTGKPAPDIFLEAARRLGVTPDRAAAFEDAISGVEACRAGRFALVVGVDRKGDPDSLLQHGADIVVSGLGELKSRSPAPLASGHVNEIGDRLKPGPALFLDYDGTLTPIVPRPEDAILSDAMRAVLKELAQLCTLAIVSGRDRADVKELVGLDDLIYAGSHGFDITGPGGLRQQNEGGVACLPDLDQAEKELAEELATVEGAQIERKRFAIAVHYRNVAPPDVDRVRNIVAKVRPQFPTLRQTGGKKIIEFRPDIDWDKGKAVLWLLNALGLEHGEVTPVYIGDDETDEDAFRALLGRGLGLLVDDTGRATLAEYRLQSPADTEAFLRDLTTKLRESTS